MLPAKIKKTNKTIIGYAFWNGTIDWSSSDIPVFVYADTTWNNENLEKAYISRGKNLASTLNLFTKLGQRIDVP